MNDPDVINILHCHTMVALGAKHKIYDGEFLMAVVDLLNEHGLAITMGECIQKAIPYFIQSIKFNMTQSNADNKAHREQHICASLTLLTVLANSCFNSQEYAVSVAKSFGTQVIEAMPQLDKESQQILRLRQ